MRTVFATCAHYWANGQTGTPTEIARKITGSGLVLPGELVGWDLETWTYRDDETGEIKVEARIWTPAEVGERADALAEIANGVPLKDQFVYLSLKDLAAADWGPIARRGIRLWVAAWDSGPVLARHWKRAGLMLRQYTSGSSPELRRIYDRDLDLNRLPLDVWTVEELQAALNLATPDLAPLVVDNDFGSASRSRVAEYQGRKGLRIDGNPGPKTLGTLTRAIV